MTRTTTTTYANSGASAQVITSAVTAGTGTLVPVTTMGYDTLTGLPTTTSNGTKTQTVAYDDFGQPLSYTDGDGAKTITTRDGQDRPSAVTWTKTDGVSTLGSVSYAYIASASGDHRGQVGSVTDSVFGAVVGSYDVAGGLSSQTLASGLTQSFTTDPVGDTTSTSWADGAGIVFLTDSQVSDVHGRWRIESLAGVDPGWNARTYGYDGAGRLTSVAEVRSVGGCLTRSYGLDVNSNRTSAVTYPGDAAGGCTTTSTPTAATTVNVDDADRMLPTGTATGTVYDPWGRITTLPAALTSTPTAGVAGVTYYANDLVRSLSQGGATRTWALDPANRVAAMSSTGLGATALTNHYGDPGSDSPTWTVDTAADATVTTRRYVGGLAGFLAEVTTTAAGVSTSTVELTGLHGDVLRTSTPTATGSPDGPGNDTDEYGIVHDSTGAITTGPRYNWLGGKQRATDTGTTGLTLMGVRLYTPITGRFLSTDPIYGGNATAYGYPADPVNRDDASGCVDCAELVKSMVSSARRLAKDAVAIGKNPHNLWLRGGAGRTVSGELKVWQADQRGLRTKILQWERHCRGRGNGPHGGSGGSLSNYITYWATASEPISGSLRRSSGGGLYVDWQKVGEAGGAVVAFALLFLAAPFNFAS